MSQRNNNIPPKPERKRGRPPGKNRVALTPEERKERNAQYERERRADCACATRALIRLMGRSPKVHLDDLLNGVVDYIENKHQEKKEYRRLSRRNAELKAKVEELKTQLAQQMQEAGPSERKISSSSDEGIDSPPDQQVLNDIELMPIEDIRLASIELNHLSPIQDFALSPLQGSDLSPILDINLSPTYTSGSSSSSGTLAEIFPFLENEPSGWYG